MKDCHRLGLGEKTISFGPSSHLQLESRPLLFFFISTNPPPRPHAHSSLLLFFFSHPFHNYNADICAMAFHLRLTNALQGKKGTKYFSHV